MTPCNECGSASSCRSDVGVVGANCKTGGIPFEENLLAGEAEGLGLVVGNARSTTMSSNIQVLTASRDIGDRRVSDPRANILAAILSSVIGRVAVDVGIIQDVEGREVLPCSINHRVSVRSDKRC